MERIRLDFCGFWGSFQKEDNLFTRMLSRHFKVEISDDPDFVICSNRSSPFAYMRYDCVRIMFMGENLSPDFSVFDYVIGFDRLSFGDRYFRLPFAYYSNDAIPWEPEPLLRARAEEILQGKDIFCNFIYGHPSATGMRERLFEALAAYKPVLSPGRYLNNTGSDGCSWAEKHDILRRSKFTIAGDSVSYPGFITEKVTHPLQAHSVPVYFGSPTLPEDINENAVVWCRSDSPADIAAAVERVRYLDTHDDAYIETLMQYPLPKPDLIAERYAALETFLVQIFSQPPEAAARRMRFFCAELHESYLKDYMKKTGRVSALEKAKKEIRKRLK